MTRTNGSLTLLSAGILNDRPFALIQSRKSEMVKQGYKKENLKIKYKQWRSLAYYQDVKFKVMKTNKEIKPFKMRLSQNQALIVENILKYAELNINFVASKNKDLCCVVYSDKTFSIIMTANYDRVGEDNTDEITYSEFMKLHGEEEEVFTREDMKEFAKYYGRRSKIISIENHLTNFLSERTND